MKDKKQKYTDILLGALWLGAVLFTCFSFARERVVCCDYVSINGDFQSYNVFRRVLAGQKPYVDFANYIGMAPIFVNLPFLALKNTFANSLFVTNFTSALLFCLSAYIVLKLFSGDKYFSAFVSALIPKFISSQILLRVLGPKYGYIYTRHFTGLFTPSNSMRGVRSFLPFLFCLLTFAAKFIFQKTSGEKISLVESLNQKRVLIAVGLIQGLLAVWSNDFGIACIAAFGVMYIFLQIFKYKDSFADFLIKMSLYLLCRAAGLFISARIVTGGEPWAFFSSMAGTAEYQFFYFNGTGAPLLQYILGNRELMIFTALYILLLLFYLAKLIRSKAADRDIAAVFILLSIAAGTYAYIVSGSGYNFKEAFEVYGILAAAGIVYSAAVKRLPSLCKITRPAFLGLCAVICLYFGAVAVKTTSLPAVGEYLPELGGTTTLHKALVESKELIGQEQVFSVYATGLETVTGQFQPSGYDYIIHCLGKEAREKYVQSFRRAQPEFVQTPSLDVGVWVASANWFFYREFLNSYEKVSQTEYSWIWQKCPEKVIDAKVDYAVAPQRDGSVIIDVTSDCTDPFIAELYVDYRVDFTSPAEFINALGRTYLIARQNICFDMDSYSIAMPARSAEYIPVRMEDGKGQLVLYGAFEKGVKVTVNSARYTGAYRPFYLKEEPNSPQNMQLPVDK